MKKIISYSILLLVCLIILIIPSFAATQTEYADTLKSLGLFQGDGKSYGLERAPTRVEASVMLIRLIGKEATAKSMNASHPFTDVPDWADPYVGYMYENNLTNGIGNNLFGAGQLSNTQQYTTFLLRALGYDDSKGDFKFSEAIPKAISVGILSTEKAAEFSQKTFIRGDMVEMSFKSLSVKTKAGTDTLLGTLVQQGAVQKDAADKSGLLPTPEKNILSLQIYKTNEGSYQAKINPNDFPDEVEKKCAAWKHGNTSTTTALSNERAYRFLCSWFYDGIPKGISEEHLKNPWVWIDKNSYTIVGFFDETGELLAYMQIPLTYMTEGTINAELITDLPPNSKEIKQEVENFVEKQFSNAARVDFAAIQRKTMEIPKDKLDPNSETYKDERFFVNSDILPDSVKGYKYVRISGTTFISNEESTIKELIRQKYCRDGDMLSHAHEPDEIYGYPDLDDIDSSGLYVYFFLDANGNILGYAVMK